MIKFPKKAAAVLLCTALAVGSVITANAATDDENFKVLGKTFTLGDNEIGASAYNLDLNDTAYMQYKEEKTGELYMIKFFSLGDEVKTFSFPKDSNYDEKFICVGPDGGGHDYEKIYTDDTPGEYVRVRLKLHDIEPDYFTEKGTTIRKGVGKGTWEYNYKTQYDGDTIYRSGLVFCSNGFRSGCAPDKDGFVEIYLSTKIGSTPEFMTGFDYFRPGEVGGAGGRTGSPVYNLTFGNVNSKSRIDVTDVTDIQKYAANMTDFDKYQKFTADVNRDGTVNVVDATLIQKYVIDLYK